jgi:DNA-binding response OmpR family regulator
VSKLTEVALINLKYPRVTLFKSFRIKGVTYTLNADTMKNKRILIIEDDTDILDSMQLILEEEGFDVIGLSHIEPVEEIAEYQPKLILLDVRLTGEYGNVFCCTLKQSKLTTNIPVILVSGASNLVEIARKCKADDFLPKPFDLDILVELVKRYF